MTRTHDGRTGELIRWILLAALALGQFLPPAGVNPGIAAIVGELPVIIALLHFAAWTRWRTALLGLLAMYGIAYLSEFLGTHTGVIFGRYFYSPTDIGPLAFEVPILLPLAYFSMGYCSYQVVRICLRNVNRRLGGIELVITSLLSALVMSAIDIVSDPIAATLFHKWTWEEGGAYFGVPVHNFYGWLGTTFTFFIVVSLIVNARTPIALIARPRSTGFWSQGIVLYATFGLGVVLNPLLGRTNEIYDSMAMLAAFMLTVPILIAAHSLTRRADWLGSARLGSVR